MSDEIGEALVLLADRVQGVLLAGSRATGEHDRAHGFGDWDVYILVFNAKERLHAEEFLSGYPMVHASYLGPGRVSLPPTFRLFEAKSVGLTFGKADVRSYLPEVTSENIDSGDVNDILIWRMLSLQGAQKRSLDETSRSYAAAKNWLDFGIWLSVQSGTLIAGHANRIAHFSKQSVSLEPALSVEISAWLLMAEAALSVKLGKAYGGGPSLRQCQELYVGAARRVLARDVPRPALSDLRIRRRIAVIRNLLAYRGNDLKAMDVTRLVLAPHRYMLELCAGSDLSSDWNRIVAIHQVIFAGAVE